MIAYMHGMSYWILYKSQKFSIDGDHSSTVPGTIHVVFCVLYFVEADSVIVG